MSDNKQLAELVGFEAVQYQPLKKDHFPYESFLSFPLRWRYPNGETRNEAPDFTHSLDALAKWVYPVLWEKGLWDGFSAEWQNPGHTTLKDITAHRVYDFLYDTQGQVKAAIEVLKA